MVDIPSPLGGKQILTKKSWTMPARNARRIMYQIQTIMGPKLSKMSAKAFSGGHNHGTQHSACVSSQNQKAGKFDLAMYDAISYMF